MAAEMVASGMARSVDWGQVLIAGAPRRRELEGRRIADLAAEAGKPPSVWILDALLETELDTSMILFQMSEDNVRLQLRHPAMMIGTDGFGRGTEGPLSEGLPHPRNYGTFPRLLRRYVREQGILSLEQAVWKMSGLPAQKLRWVDRGLVKKGYQADLVVLDPETVADRATYEMPHQYPVGIPHVIVNGTPVIYNGVHTQARPGRTLGRR
jgi:N-acyl-D-amino-acid deacylase